MVSLWSSFISPLTSHLFVNALATFSKWDRWRGLAVSITTVWNCSYINLSRTSSSVPFRLRLAFLLWFMKKATKDFSRAETNLNPTASPYLNNITYFFCRTGVYGVLFVDDNFGYWYNTLLGDSENQPDIHPRHASSNSVVAVYPTDDVSLRDADEIEACWNICRLVQYVTCLSGQYWL